MRTLPITTARPEPPEDGDGVRLTLRHDGWRLDLFTLHTPHAFWSWASLGFLGWSAVSASGLLAALLLAVDPIVGLVWALLASFGAAQLALIPLATLLLLRVRSVELGRGRLLVAGILGEPISVPLDGIEHAWADGEDLVITHARRGLLRLPLRAGSAGLRQWLAASVDEAARLARETPHEAVPHALTKMLREQTP